MKTTTKTHIAKNTTSKRVNGNVFNYYFENDNFIFFTSNQRLLIDNKREIGMVVQYGDVVNKPDFVRNVYDYIINL